MMSNGQETQAPKQLYRVNRLGREVFCGELPDFEDAIKSQQIRPDDLIFDEQLQNWTFARNHEVFMRLSGAAFDELKKNRQERRSSIPFGRIFSSVLILSAILYILMNYSKSIQFKSREGSEALSDTRELRDTRGAADQGDSAAESGAGTGAGKGQGLAEGQGLEETSLSELDEERRATRDLNGEPLEMVFDLEAEGLKEHDILKLTRGQAALRDEALLTRANEIYAANERGRHGLNRLLEAIGYVEFVLRRAQTRDGKEHAKAKLTLAHLNERFVSRCESLYAPKVCALKVEHPRWSDGTIQAIVNQRVLVGMTRDQAELAWGRPKKVSRQRAEGGLAAELCYDASCERALTVDSSGLISGVKP